MPLVLAFLAFLSTGCLPLLITSAKTMRPGDMSLTLAGTGRTQRITNGVKQAGPAAGIVELRGGLPFEGFEAGLALQIPWTMMTDIKYGLTRESMLLPATAIRGQIGVLQPSVGASFLVTKTFGAAELTGMAGISRLSERLWKEGSSPFSSRSENLQKDVYSWGAGMEWAASPIHRLFVCGVSTSSVNEREFAEETGVFGVEEGPCWFFSAGMRIVWRMPPFRKSGALTALRGYMLSEFRNGSFDIGQPGVYRAVVMTDAYTQVTEDGKPVSMDKLTPNRAILIQGIPLPKPSTFLARTIELQ